MGLNSPVSSLLQYTRTRSASDFLGIPEVSGACALFSTASGGGSLTGPHGPHEDGHCEHELSERKRIAQELHDTLLQGFLAVSMQLHTAVDQLPAECASAKPRFSHVLQLLDRVLEQGRCAVQGLRSPGGRIGSLSEALAGVPNDLGFGSTAAFRVVVHGRQRELRAALRHEVYRICREAIGNACRHSGATEIEVDVEYRSTELRIAICDNGCGIDTEHLRWGRDGHWGLQGMRERAEQIGARLRLWSRVALGTELELRVPGRVAYEASEIERAGQ
jgi:signal transduction histidine kinase